VLNGSPGSINGTNLEGNKKQYIQMPHILKYILCIAFLTLSVRAESQTCYVTKSGTKYHKSSCSYLQHSKIAYDLTKAKHAGFTPCSRCKPTKESLRNASSSMAITPVTRTTTTVQCMGKTQAGVRCRNKTKNANGLCYVHSK